MSDRRGRLTTSARTSHINTGIALAAFVGLIIAAAVVAVTVIGRRPIPGLGALLVPAIPLLFAGQAWSIAIIIARRPRPPGPLRARFAAQWSAQRNPRTYFFPDLPLRAAYAVIGAFVVGWLAGMTAFPSLDRGSPAPRTPGCRWPLITMVSFRAFPTRPTSRSVPPANAWPRG